jgi:chromosome partitioning protein
MKIVALLAEKGGVGKTTLALDLAVAATTAGQKAAVIDIDPQATATQWADRRKEEFPWVVSTHAIRIQQTLDQARANSVDLVLIDTPPHSGPDALIAAKLSDLVLLPVEPHLFSLETVQKQADLLRAANNPPAVYIVNKAPVQGSEAQDAMQYIEAEGFTVCPVIMHNRAVHRHASNVGRSAIEHRPKSKAALETQQLYRYTTKHLQKETRSK